MSRLILLAVIWFGGTLSTVQANSLYQIEMVVADQSTQQRQIAMQSALQQVALKVVGNSELLAQKDLSPVLKQTSRLIKQYQYQPLPAQNEGGQRLSITFDKQKLNTALTQLNLPIWPSPRQEVLLWLLVNQNGKQTVVGSGQQSAVYQIIETQAKRRGLSLFLPLVDLHDQHQLRFAETASALTADNAFITAAQRYGNQIVLVAKVNQTGQLTQINWQWYYQQRAKQITTEGELSQALIDGINKLTDTLASQFATIDISAKRDYDIVIDNVQDFSEYSRILSYLKGMAEVRSVKTIQLQNKQLSLMLKLSEPLTVFNQAIEIDGILAHDGSSVDKQTIQYRLTP